jgi:hypothetical protein
MIEDIKLKPQTAAFQNKVAASRNVSDEIRVNKPSPPPDAGITGMTPIAARLGQRPGKRHMAGQSIELHPLRQGPAMIEYGPVPPHVAAAKATVAQWLSDEDAAIRAAQNRGPSAAERYDAIRTAQAHAMSEGRVLPVPPAPVAVAVAPDLGSMSASERWAHMRRT